MLKTFNIHLTPKINLKILKKNNNFLIYIYNNFYFLKLILDKSSQLFFEENSMTLVIQFKFLKNNNKILENLINDLIFSLNHLWFAKIKFTGKGYKIKRYRPKKSIDFFFYHSHWTVIIFKNLRLIKKHKYKFYISKNNKRKLNLALRMILKIRPVNTYTKRGLRNSRQLILKRTGKKSTYI